MTKTITLRIENPVGMRCLDSDGNLWSTIFCREPSYICMECGKLIDRCYYTQRNGERRYLCPEHVELVSVDADTTISGYSPGHWHESVCNCYATDTLDCQRNGCHAEPGQRQFVADVRNGVYDDVAAAQAEREGLDGYDPLDFVCGFERLVAGE